LLKFQRLYKMGRQWRPQTDGVTRGTTHQPPPRQPGKPAEEAEREREREKRTFPQ
jgi:hypothetical protein